jgi:hypothetical protein
VHGITSRDNHGDSQQGVASFNNLSYPAAETINILFSSGTLTNVISGTVVVSPGLLPSSKFSSGRDGCSWHA